MAEARANDAWNHTAPLLALTANCHRDPKKARAFKPRDFHPHAKTKSTPVKAPVSVLKLVFIDNPKRA